MQALAGFIVSIVLSVLVGVVTFAVTGSGGTAATFGVIAFLAVGLGCIVFTSDTNWFD